MKLLMFTDIHFGKKGNSLQHNQDCIDFIVWALEVAKEQGARHIAFLGDWHDNRTEINSKTLNYSQEGLELLNDAEHIDHVYFIAGNHDLANRNNRDFTSLPHTRSLPNIGLIDEPIQHGDMLFLPFLFPHEYDEALKDTSAKYVFGHLEFAGFIMAGSHYRMEKGPEARYYTKPDYIFTGHFHTRQIMGNTIYIGNAFPMDYSDAGDLERGVCILDTEAKGKKRVKFIDWPNAPSYTRVNLSELMEAPDKFLRPKGCVTCTVDIDISYVEAMELKSQLTEDFGLRIFSTKDQIEADMAEALEEDNAGVVEEVEMSDMTTMVVGMLGEVSSENINNDKLKQMFLEI